MANEIILYDIPSKQGTSWSLNPWKTRLYLNYKNIPYKTEWTAYPDLEPKFEKFGIPPNETGTKYTAPTVKMPDGSYVVDSRRIAEGLDRIYPDPPLHIESKYQAPVEAALGNIMRCIRSVYMPLVPKMFLNPRCRDYFVATREKVVGMPLDEFGKTADHDVKSAEPYVRELSALLTETDGPFFEGKAPCYADFVVVAWVKMLKGLGVEEKIYALEGGEQLKKQYEAAQASGWFDRDSY